MAPRDGVGNSAQPQGFITVQYVAATAFALLLLVFSANLLVDLYVRAAVRDALDEGVRAAVPIGRDAQACRERTDDALSSLVRGEVVQGVTTHCAVANGWVVAEAQVTLPSFLTRLVPAWRFELRATARKEAP